VTHYLVEESSEQAALGFVAEIEQAYARLSRHANVGSPRYAYELDIPGLRSWPLDRYPHLIFYIERETHVEIWRVLNGKRYPRAKTQDRRSAAARSRGSFIVALR
jgi:toxin ParE1/3/4